MTEDGDGYTYTDAEAAEMEAWVGPALQRLRDERALTVDALALVSQVAEREPVRASIWDRRECVYCGAFEYATGTAHQTGCLWLACRQLTQRAAALNATESTS